MADVYKDPWTRLYELWDDHYLPPGRPSKGELEIYKKMLEKHSKKNGRALVLGATRELRNLLHSMNYGVCIVDINQQALDYFNRFVPRWKEEEHRLGDWCAIDFPDKSFDAILGDVPVANVPLEMQPEFYANVGRMLKDSGVFIHRAEIVDEKDYDNDPTEIIEYYANAPIPRDYGQHAFEFVCMLLARSVDRKTNLSSIQKAMEFMRKGSEKYPKLRPLYEHNDVFWRDLDKKWVFETEDNFVKRMSVYFDVVERRASDDNAMKELWPVYACKKRLKRK